MDGLFLMFVPRLKPQRGVPPGQRGGFRLGERGADIARESIIA
jgi:hypothetical protein